MILIRSYVGRNISIKKGIKGMKRLTSFTATKRVKVKECRV
jgi:hypothetical protein